MSLSKFDGLFEDTKRMKMRIITLSADNNNQSRWIVSVRTWARAKSAMYFLMAKANHYRVVRTDDLSAQGALPIGIK